MTRTLSVAVAPTEQYVNFIAGEAIRTGDPLALGLNDGKVYYLNDPAATDVAGNNLRNFALANSTAPTLFKPTVTTAISNPPSNATMIKLATLSNGSTAFVWSVQPLNTLNNANQAFGINAAYGMSYCVIDSNGAFVQTPTTLTGTGALGNTSMKGPGIYFNAPISNVTLLALSGGGFAVCWVDNLNSTVTIKYATFNNNGIQTLAPTIVASPSTATVQSLTVNGLKMIVLPNGNFAFAWARNNGTSYDSNNPNYQIPLFELTTAIYTPTGTVVKAPSVLVGANSQLGNGGQVGSGVQMKPINMIMLPFANSNFLLAFTFVDFNANGDAKINSTAYSYVFSPTGAAIGAQNNHFTRSASFAATALTNPQIWDVGMLGCIVASGKAMLFMATQAGDIQRILTIDSSNVVTVLRTTVVSSNNIGGAVFGGPSGGFTTGGGCLDQMAYSMIPFDTGAILVTEFSEQIINAAGATVASAANALGANCKPNPNFTVTWPATPQIITTTFGQTLTLTSLPETTEQLPLPYIPLVGTTGFSMAGVTVPTGGGWLRSFGAVANPQNTAANCFQVTFAKSVGYSYTYGYTDAVQGLTFIGVAKAASSKDNPVSVQVLGQAKLRFSFSKPMVIDTRGSVTQGAVANGAAVFNNNSVVKQGNTFGVAATIFGDAAFLKGLG